MSDLPVGENMLQQLCSTLSPATCSFSSRQAHQQGLQCQQPAISLVQVLERRSAVSRQACHIVTVLAEACGEKLEPLALQLLPALLKAIAMGIQVNRFMRV